MAADAQEALLRWRQGRWDRTWGGSTEPLTSILLPDRLNEFVKENLSIGAKARRESQNRRRVDYIAGLADANEMQHLAQRSKWLANVGAKLGRKERQGMSRGEFKAMEILSWDDLDPVAAERAFHERMIERFTVTDKTPPSLRKPLNKMRENHERALADMKLAEQVLENPSERFKQVLGKVLDVEGQTFARRVERLGLNPETGFGRIAKGGIVLREAETIMERNRLTDSIALLEGLVASQVKKTGQADAKLVASLEKNRGKLAAIPDPFKKRTRGVAPDLGEGVVYHGSPEGEIGNIDTLRHTQAWREGLGFYVTESPAKATGYARGRTAKGERRSGARESGAVHAFKIDPAAKVLDMEAPADLAFWRKIAEHELPGDEFDHYVVRQAGNNPTNGRIREELLIQLEDTHGTDALYALEDRLAEAGIRATTHFEGKGEDRHRVWVVKDESLLERQPGVARVAEIPSVESTPKPVASDASSRAEGARLAPSFYVHAEPRGKSPKPSSRTRGFFSLSRRIRVGQPRPLAELGHEFTGKSIIVGNNRVDVPDLTHEAAAKTMRAVQVLDEHEKLWESALTAKPTTGKWIPIMPLGSGKIPDLLRELDQRIHEGVVSQKDADLLTGDEYELIRALYPDEASLSPEEIKDVRWVDPVLIPDPVSPTTRAHAAFEGTMNVINAPYRTLALYARPAYALNKLGNRVMLVVDEGIWTSAQNMARANNIEQLYGSRAAAQIHQHVGAGKSLSYINPGVGKVSRGLAEWWSKWADRDERSAAFLYWADRNGYRTREEMHKLLFDEDPKVRADLNDTVQRANKSLVRFDDLGEMGKAWLRHLIFVYPWVRGSAIWSIQMLAEHPAKASVYAALGQEAIDKDPFFKFASDWYKRVGYIPWERFGVPTDRVPFLPGADHDHLSNPSSTWTFDTLTEMAAVGKSQTVGDKYASLADLFGPAAETIAHGSLGRDKYGNRYPNWPWARAMAETLEVLPQVRAIDQKIKKGQGTDFDIRRRGSLEASLNKHARDSVFGPGWLWGTGALLAGGLSPKTLNIPAKTERYWNDQTPAVQHAHTKDLLNYALTLQGKFLDTPVPAEVRNRLNDRLAIAYQWKKHVTETGKSPSTRDKVNYTIDYLDSHGRISSDEADKLRKGLADQHPWTIDKFLSDTIRLHAGGKALEEWDADVNALYSFKKDTFNYNAGRLHKQGLSPRANYDDVSQKELTEYGRGYIDFSHKVRALDEKVKAKKAEPSDIRSFEDANSEPRNGLPSYAAIAWVHRHDSDMAAATGRLAGHTWGSLSRVEKQILGRSVSVETQKSWDFYRGSLKANQEANGSTSYADRVYIANAIGKTNPDFLTDWKVSQQSRADRFVTSPLYKGMPSEASWIFEYARKAGALIQEARVDPAGARSTVTDVREAWKDYVESTVKPWVEAHPAVKHALAPYGDSFLGGLPNNG